MDANKAYESVMKVMNRESIEKMVISRIRPSKDAAKVEERDYVRFAFLDLIETFHVPMDENDEYRLVITEAILNKVGMTPKELLEAAHRNIDKKWKLRNLSELLSEMSGVPFSESDMEIPLLIATTDSGDHGASVILSDSLMKAVSEMFKGDVIVLPSSVHEVLFIPGSADYGYEEILSVVRTINRNEVSEEDFLSDNVYVYKDGKFEIID